MFLTMKTSQSVMAPELPPQENFLSTILLQVRRLKKLRTHRAIQATDDTVQLREKLKVVSLYSTFYCSRL